MLAESAQRDGRHTAPDGDAAAPVLVAEGHQVGVRVVNDAVAEWKRQRREVFVPLTYRPGDLSEVDFFELGRHSADRGKA